MTLQTERIGTLDGVRAFVEGSGPVDFKLADRASAHDFVRRTLVRFGYHVRGKPAKGLLRAFLGKATGLSRAQVARLIRQHRETGKVEDRRRGPPARPFQRKYTKADVRLLAEAGCSTSCASGTSPSRAPGARTTTRLWKARTAPVAAGRGGWLRPGVTFEQLDALAFAMLLSLGLIVLEEPLLDLLGSFDQTLVLAGFDITFVAALVGLGAALGMAGALLAVRQRLAALDVM